MTGALIRNTEPHQKCSNSSPPSTGPSAPPPPKAAAHTAMARRRSCALSKMVRINPSVDGMRVAAEAPRAARARISSSGLGANAVAKEAKPNAGAPIMSMRLRPKRSPSEPARMSRPASRKL